VEDTVAAVMGVTAVAMADAEADMPRLHIWRADTVTDMPSRMLRADTVA
jgi:hypothetical protein